MKKKAIEMIPFGKEKIHKLDDCFMIDGKLIDRKTNNINVRICLRENEFANYIEGTGWNKKRLNNWASNNVFRASFELSTKERKELAEFYEKTKPEWECIRDPGQQIEHYQDRICGKKAERREQKRNEKIKEHLAEIRPYTDQMSLWASNQMESYLFYKYSTGYCGYCGKTAKFDRKKIKITHNMKGTCPNCKKKIVFKAAGRQPKIEERMRVVRFQKTKFGIAAIESIVIKGSYAENQEKTKTIDYYIWFIEEEYELYNNVTYTGHEWRDANYGVQHGEARIYTRNIKQVIKGTCLEYSGIDIVASWKGKRERYQMIVENYRKNPEMELLIKANMRKLTRQAWWYEGYLYKGTKLHEVLGLTKPNMRKARDYDFGINEIRVMRNDPYGKLTDDEIIALSNAGHHLIALRTFTTIKKIANYTRKGHDAGIWLDYLKMAQDLGYNMKDKAVLFPRKLKDRHDDLTKIMKIQGDNIREKKYQQRIQELKALYSYETSKYKIIVPKSLKEIAEEGRNLHHCVGTYTEKVAEGETDILFIRKQGEEDTSYYTMEVRNLEIIQYRGAYNNLHDNPVPKEIDQLVRQFHNALIKRVRKAA
jgi:hypothetical protein